MRAYLSFETPVAEIDARVDELRALVAKGDSPALAEELAKLEARSAKTLAELYAALTPWQKTQVARVQGRPHFNDYVKGLIEDFTPLAGDRKFGEDAAIVGGLGRFRGSAICLIGNEKGDDTQSRLAHNFGSARPEGYRKAARLMELADRFGLPVLGFIDTARAYTRGGGAARARAEAIARSTAACLELGVPNIAVVIGEGGSGGAIALATANRVLMLEHAIYSVISPEGAASILWRDTTKAQEAASSMKITAEELMRLGVVDTLVPQPTGGARRDPPAAIAATGAAIADALAELQALDPATVVRLRREKFMAIGRTLS